MILFVAAEDRAIPLYLGSYVGKDLGNERELSHEKQTKDSNDRTSTERSSR